MASRVQTRKEEQWNTITHAIGFCCCIVGIPVLLSSVIEKNNPTGLVAAIAFFIGMLSVYGFSTAYHFTCNPQRKKILKKFDHISIYFLIAGTYSPLMVIYLDVSTAIIFLAIIWGIALLGVFYKLFFINRLKWISVTTYLLMGWMIVFVIKPLIQNIPLSVFWWILAGGISYTIGVYFYVKSDKRYYHVIWHLFVLLGTFAHFVAIYKSYR